MKIPRKVSKYIPIGTIIVIIASMVGWGLHKLAFLAVACSFPGYSEFQQVGLIVLGGILLLMLLGYNVKKIFT